MKKKLLGMALAFIALAAVCTGVLYLALPRMQDGMETTFTGWHLVRTIALGTALATFLSMAFALIWNRRRIIRFMPAFRKYLPLLKLLVRKDFLIRYKRSVLGVLWTLLNPLANMVIMSIIFSYLFQQTIPYFPAFVLSGSIVFTCFSEATNGGLHSVIGNASLLKKVYVPKYIFPLANTFTAFTNILFSMIALFIVMLFTGAPFQPTMFLIPLALLYLFLFCVGCSLLLATSQVFFRDTAYLYGVLLTAMNYLSAIFYDINIVPTKFMPLFAINPMYHYVDFFRKVALQGTLPRVWDHMVCLGFGLVALVAGVFVFYRKQNQFILHI